ncbi:MAG: amidohydrolase [Lachnospiraceae bacterium]|nr:amidohydrolase [Lachnospiraceae bacterium]
MVYRVKDYEAILTELNGKLWDLAEIRFEEFESSRLTAKVLEEHGYAVESGVGGLPTAYKAVYGSGSPVLGLLAEYDALDGLSQEADALEKRVRPGTSHGHGCGHHLLGTGIIGAALALREYAEAHPGKGTIIVYGCPAEEGGSGKTYMARAGVFDGIDIALTWHPGTMNAAMTGSLLANCQAYFRFHGVSSHAGAAPQKGRSALDALELMNVGVNYLREHMEMTDRIHYAITNTGGISPNVVQAEAEVLYLVRSRDNESVKELYRRVVNIAKGAALMTGTTLEIEFDKACSNVVPSDTLGQLLYDSMIKIGVPMYTEEERRYILGYRKVIGDKAADNDAGLLPEFDMETRGRLCREHPLGDFILPFEPQDVIETASSDMGDISQIAPLLQLQCACFSLGTQPHSWMQVAQGKSSYAVKGMLFAAQTITEAAVSLMENPELVEKAKEEKKRRTKGRTYECPIPEGVVPAAFRKKGQRVLEHSLPASACPVSR